MKKYTRVDNIKRDNSAIWSISLLLGNPNPNGLDASELEGISTALLTLSRKIESYCFELLPDEEDKKEDIAKKIDLVEQILINLKKSA